MAARSGGIRVAAWIPPVFVQACVVPDPAPEDPRFHPDIVYAAGTFAFDARTGEAAPYTIDGEAVPITVDILVLDARWFDTGAPDRVCALTLTSDARLGAARWAGDTDAARFGFDLPDDAEVTGDCPPWDPDVWGNDLVAALTAGPWGLGVGPLDPDVEARVRADLQANGGSWADDRAPWAVGGGFRWGPLEGVAPAGFVSNDIATAYEATDGLALTLAGGTPTPIPAEDALPDGPLPTAVWVLEIVYGVDAGFLLDGAPFTTGRSRRPLPRRGPPPW